MHSGMECNEGWSKVRNGCDSRDKYSALLALLELDASNLIQFYGQVKKTLTSYLILLQPYILFSLLAVPHAQL